MIEAILFDFGQTLVDAGNGFRLAEKEAERQIFSHLGLDSWEEFLSKYREVRKAFHSRSEFSRASMWQAILEHYGDSVGNEQLREWEDGYWETVKRETRPFPETEPILLELSTEYRLALITNTQGQGRAREHRIRDMPDFERFFEVIIVAGESGIQPKPHSAPFSRCLKLLKISTFHAVYVGDDWEIDICGAREAGIHPIWIQHASVQRFWPPGDGSVPIITSLRPLLKLEDVLAAPGIG